MYLVGKGPEPSIFTPPRLLYRLCGCMIRAISEEQFLANVEYIAEHLLPFGYDTVTVDCYWYLALDGSKIFLDEYGMALAVPGR